MSRKKRINLALQGGGAHGAFTWGVLDRLLDEPEVEIAAMSGTSAGALNGAALKAGMIKGGRDGARDALEQLWSQIGAVPQEPYAQWLEAWSGTAPLLAKAIEYSPAFAALDIASRMMSPYATGPFLENPLARIVSGLSYDAVCADHGPQLFVGATNVRTGKIRVFQGTEISPEAILASACLPTLFRAVEIDGEAYWDGGYTGNPALFPLFDSGLPDDVVIVNINPLVRDEIPKDPQAIQNRINEISFNSSLLRELRAIDFVRRLLRDGALRPGTMKNVLVHMIADDALMNELSVATKLVPTPITLARLKSAGVDAANRFLRDEIDKVGVESSVDLEAMFG